MPSNFGWSYFSSLKLCLLTIGLERGDAFPERALRELLGTRLRTNVAVRGQRISRMSERQPAVSGRSEFRREAKRVFSMGERQ